MSLQEVYSTPAHRITLIWTSTCWFHSEEFKHPASEHCLSHFPLIWSSGTSPSSQWTICLKFKWKEWQWADNCRNVAQRQDLEQGCTSGSWWWLQYSCNASSNALPSATTQVLSRHTRTKPPALHPGIMRNDGPESSHHFTTNNLLFLHSVHSSKMEK